MSTNLNPWEIPETEPPTKGHTQFGLTQAQCIKELPYWASEGEGVPNPVETCCQCEGIQEGHPLRGEGEKGGGGTLRGWIGMGATIEV